jgi:regulator of sirC expression with transglutaminase-like and TPR domain
LDNVDRFRGTFVGQRFLFSLDIFRNIRDSIEELMKTIRLFQRDSRPKSYGGESQIRVYRSHAARAISEERWEVAEIFLDRILKVDPDHTEAWLMKGHLRHHCREDEQTAVDCYRKVIHLCGHDSAHPHAERARSSLGRLLAVWS